MFEKQSPKYQLRDRFDMPAFFSEIISMGFDYGDIKVEKNWDDFRLYIFASKWVDNAD